jgi:hypothetical protein
MLVRMTLVLDAHERAALEQLAAQELRPMRDQARILIREAIEHRGLLPGATEQAAASKEEESRDRVR